MSIRPYTTNDYNAVLTIYANSKLDELRYEKKTFTLLPLDQDKTRLDQLLEADIYVYESDGVIGYCAQFKSEIRALFVCPSVRGKGIGETLLLFLLNKLSAPITLFVAESNTPAKQLYIKHGFKVTNTFLTHYNGVSVLANRMDKPA
jgi:putative acetyltransferase